MHPSEPTQLEEVVEHLHANKRAFDSFLYQLNRLFLRSGISSFIPDPGPDDGGPVPPPDDSGFTLLGIASQVGQVLFAINNRDFTVQQPLTDNGWIVDEQTGTLLVAHNYVA